MNPELMAALVAAPSAIVGGLITAALNGRTALAQAKAAAAVAARGPRKQAYAEFIQAVRRAVDELNDLLPGPGEDGHAAPSSVQDICERHYPRIGTAHAVVELEGPADATEAASAVVAQVGKLKIDATVVHIGNGDEYGYGPGFTADIREALDRFAKTGATVLSRAAN